jgi:hypothetical protein
LSGREIRRSPATVLHGLLIAAAILCACTSAAVPALPPALVDVPFLQIGVQPWIAVDIGAHRNVHCIVDTGATMGVLPSDLTRGADPIGSAHVVTANGAVDMPVVRVRKLSIEHTDFLATDFYQRDHSWFSPSEPMPCILGRNFMTHFTVDFDGRAQRLRLFAHGTRIDDILGGVPVTGVHLDATLSADSPIRVATSVAGIATQSQIDTGWGLATPNAALLDRLGVRTGDARIVNRTVTDSMSAQTRTLQMVELSDVRIGALTLPKVWVTVGEARMTVIDKEARPYLHVGWGLLGEHRLLLDLTHRDLALLP